MLLSVQRAMNGAAICKFSIALNDARDNKYFHLLPKSDLWDIIWAPDSQKVALINLKWSRVSVYDIGLDTDAPICSIQESALIGIERLVWTPDSQKILCFLKYRMGVRVWQLDERFPVATLPHPKHCDGGKGFAFTDDGKLMALLHRNAKDQVDLIHIYDCRSDNSLTAIQCLKCPESSVYLDDLCFSPIFDSPKDVRPSVMAWESSSFSDRIFIFYPDGQTMKSFSAAAALSTLDRNAPLCAYGADSIAICKNSGMAALAHDSTSFSIWNFFLQKNGPKISLGHACFRSGETVTSNPPRQSYS